MKTKKSKARVKGDRTKRRTCSIGIINVYNREIRYFKYTGVTGWFTYTGVVTLVIPHPYPIPSQCKLSWTYLIRLFVKVLCLGAALTTPQTCANVLKSIPTHIWFVRYSRFHWCNNNSNNTQSIQLYTFETISQRAI